MKLKNTALALAALAALGTATMATAAEDNKFNMGVAISSIGIGSTTSDGILYQGVIDYTFFEKENVELIVEGRFGASSAASASVPSSFGPIAVDVNFDSTYSVFLKSKNNYEAFSIYGLAGYTSSSATATASIGGTSVTASESASDFSYGFGLSKEFGGVEVGVEFIQYHPDTSAFGLVASKAF